MKINTFQDGDRFIVVFEGIGPKNEDLIKGLLGAVTLENSCAIPVEPENDERLLEEIQNTVAFTFDNGPYKGKTPYDIVSVSDKKEAYKGYLYLAKIAEVENDECIFMDIQSACKDFMKQWANGIDDAYAYASKLTDAQSIAFFKQFNIAIESEIKSKLLSQAGYADWSDYIAETSMDEKKAAIAAIIEKIHI